MSYKKIFSLFLLLSFLTFSKTTFAATPVLNSARITGANTVMLVFSEAVNTTLNDYGTFGGSPSGRSLTSISGSGSNIITLTFDGSPFAADATGGITIASTVKSVSDSSSLGSGPYQITDGQAPQMASFSVSSNMNNNYVLRTGSSLTVNFNTNESVTNPRINIGTNTITASGSGYGPFSATYTLTYNDTQDALSVNAQFTDIAGNQGSGSFTIGGGLGPKIISLTSNATTNGVLVPGDKINFVLILANPSPNAYVSGAYNGIPLTWSTSNGGATYTATYTVQSGNSSTSYPLQITNVTVRDSNGNVSSAFSGNDILKTINAQSFSISEYRAISTPSNTNTPIYAFYSAQDGTIKYGGDCTSPTLTAITGYNYITFSSLSEGYHNNCTITVTNQAGYSSNTLIVSPFTIQTNTTTGSTSSGGSSSYTSSYYTTSAPTVTTSSSNNTTSTNTTSTNTTTKYKFYNPLKVGSKGVDVTELQKRLKSEGYYSGPITGTFGSLTEAAVKKYQKAKKLAQLGNVGPGTRASLNK